MKKDVRIALYLFFSLVFFIAWLLTIVPHNFLTNMIIWFFIIMIPRLSIAMNPEPRGYEERHQKIEESLFNCSYGPSTIKSKIENFSKHNEAKITFFNDDIGCIDEYGNEFQGAYEIRGITNLIDSFKYPKALLFSEWQIVIFVYKKNGKSILLLEADGCTGLLSNLSLSASMNKLNEFKKFCNPAASFDFFADIRHQK